MVVQSDDIAAHTQQQNFDIANGAQELPLSPKFWEDRNLAPGSGIGGSRIQDISSNTRKAAVCGSQRRSTRSSSKPANFGLGCVAMASRR